MTSGTDAMGAANAKLDWAARHAEAMNDGFAEYARPGGGDERPIGIRFDTARRRPPGLVVAKFIIDAPMPREISLLAADSVHNARTALDYVLARLKEHMGGTPGSGGFPVAATDEEWEDRMKRSKPLKGLPQSARDFIYGEQPIHYNPRRPKIRCWFCTRSTTTTSTTSCRPRLCIPT